VRTGTTAFGLYEGNLVGRGRATLLKIRAKQILVCTGAATAVSSRTTICRHFPRRGVRAWHAVRRARRPTAVVYTEDDSGQRLRRS